MSYERSQPSAAYRRPRLWTADPLPAEVAAGDDPSQILLRVGHALRTRRRLHTARPIHLIARDAGVTDAALLKIEGGASTRVVRLVCIADALEVPLSQLLRHAGL